MKIVKNGDKKGRAIIIKPDPDEDPSTVDILLLEKGEVYARTVLEIEELNAENFAELVQLIINNPGKIWSLIFGEKPVLRYLIF